MSVDESMVILAPMSQVGCCERVGDGDARELLAGVAAERAAAGGEDQRAAPRAASPARSAW